MQSSSRAASPGGFEARTARARLVAVALVVGLGLAASAGCARVSREGGPGENGAGAATNTGGAFGSTGTGGIGRFPASGGGAGTGPDVPSGGSGQGGAIACDGGEACMCPPIKLAVIGRPGKWGANPNGDPDTALQDWLNSSSAGTAQVDNFTARPMLTPDFLGRYSVIILAALGDDSNNGPWWSFSADEQAAFRAWVENGGGVISLSGYSTDSAEVNPVNQLLAFSGISYGMDTLSGGCANQQVCTCTHSNTLSDWNHTDPTVASLATGMTFVGFANGRSIAAPADSHVAATAGGTSSALVGRLVGKGRVLVYSDEWVTYTSQWTGAGIPNANDPSCTGYLPQDRYQIAQFWYNVIRWAQPAASCFTIVGPIIIG